MNNANLKDYAIYFLGGKNSSFFYYWMFSFSYVYAKFRENSEIPLCFVALSVIFELSLFVCESMNGLLVYGIIVIYLIVSKYKMVFQKLFRPKNLLLLLVVGLIMIPFFGESRFQSFFDFIGKTTTLSGRTILWKQALDAIGKHPIFGAGHEFKYYFAYDKIQTQAHNIYLDYTAKYGLIVLSVLIIMIIHTYRRLSYAKNKKLAICSGLFLFVILFHGIFDETSIYLILAAFFFLKYAGATIRVIA